jgi:tol-pal system protein YbgF
MRMRAIVPVFAAGFCLMATAHADTQPGDFPARVNAAVSQERGPERNAARQSMQFADLFGESDAEKAAREQHEQNQDQGIATLNQRVSDLEHSLTNLTGQVEQLDHRIQLLNERIDRMQKDFDYKLCMMAAQQLGASTTPGDGDALPCDGTPATDSAPMPSPAPQTFSQSGGAASGPPQHLAPPPGVLGTIPSNTPLPLPAPSTVQGDMPPPVAHPEFQKAMSLMAKTQFAEALAGFRAYADNHPDDPLAPQALYWAGDIQYVQKDYAGSARTLAEGIKKYPDSARAPDSMLKLGESLIAMNQKKEGCTALAAIPAKYPNASKTVAAKAAAERKALCR